MRQIDRYNVTIARIINNEITVIFKNSQIDRQKVRDVF